MQLICIYLHRQVQIQVEIHIHIHIHPHLHIHIDIYFLISTWIKYTSTSRTSTDIALPKYAILPQFRRGERQGCREHLLTFFCFGCYYPVDIFLLFAIDFSHTARRIGQVSKMKSTHLRTLMADQARVFCFFRGRPDRGGSRWMGFRVFGDTVYGVWPLKDGFSKVSRFWFWLGFWLVVWNMNWNMNSMTFH